MGQVLRSAERHEHRDVTGQAVLDLEVVVPAFNEQDRLSGTLSALTSALAGLPVASGVLVVDNGSIDATAEITRATASRSPVPVRLVGCSRQGKGAAVRRGMLGSEARWIGFCDADLATSCEALSRVVVELLEGADVVIGSRRHHGAHLVVPHGPVRRAGSIAFHRLVRDLVPGVTDTQCGFKFFRREVARAVFTACTCSGFAFDVEVLALAAHHGASVVEVPVEWTAQSGSTFRVLQHGRHVARELLAIRAAVRAATVAGHVAPGVVA